MVKYLIVVFVLISLTSSGQDKDYGLAEKLAAGINSECDEVFPLLSPDGKTLYFTRVLCDQNKGGKFTGTDIWSSQSTGAASWGLATNEDALNDRDNSTIVGIGDKGDMFYMLKTNSIRRPEGIYQVRHMTTGWSKPTLAPVEGLEPDEFLGMYVTSDQTAMIISMNGLDSKGKEDLYISLKNERGGWSKPKNMGSTINTTGFEMSPFLSTDKKRLYFTSNGHPGLGNGDIFYCDRLYDSWEIWSAPKNLGDRVNSKSFDAYFSIYGDSIAYFSSNRENQMDLYKVAVREKKSLADEDLRKYLTDEEIQQITGTVIQPLFYFDIGDSELNDYQKQNLIRIKNSLVEEKEIKFNVIAMKPVEANLETYQTRLLNMLDFLKEAGIEGNRIIFSVQQMGNAAQGKEMVRIRFYK